MASARPLGSTSGMPHAHTQDGASRISSIMSTYFRYLPSHRLKLPVFRTRLHVYTWKQGSQAGC
jgi:hypothetical protein